MLGGGRELEGEAIAGRPVIGARLDLGLEGGEQGRLAGAVGAAHCDAPGRLRAHQRDRFADRAAQLRAVAAALAQHQPVEVDAAVEIRVLGRLHVVDDAADAGPHRQHVVPAAGELVHVVGHLDLARQGGGERDQELGVAGVVPGHEHHGREHDREPEDAAEGAQPLARHDGGDLGAQAVAQLGFEAAQPEVKIVAVAGEHVVPGRIAVGDDAVVLALVLQIDARHAPAQRPLQRHQDREDRPIGGRQAAVDLHAEHGRIEDEAEQQLELRLELIHDVEDVIEGGAGQEGLDLLARGLVG